jgi:hypothetical protein
MPPITGLVVDDYEPFRRFVCSMLEERAEFQVIGKPPMDWKPFRRP